MMGQGEPLLNLPNVLKATRLLTDPEAWRFRRAASRFRRRASFRRSRNWAREPVRPKLAISLNASTEEQRQELMPITRKYHLKDLIEACRAYPLRPWEKLTFEYVLLKGVNDTDADARRVVKLLAHLNCKVNLIALNPGPGIPFETPDPERVASFQAIVRRVAAVLHPQAARPGCLRRLRAVEAERGVSVPSTGTIALLLCGVAVSVAQDGTASLTGSVRDIGVGVFRAYAELWSEGSQGRAFRIQADDSGTFRFTHLQAGEYSLKFGQAGFQSLTIEAIHVSVSEEKSIPPAELNLSDNFCGGYAVPDYLRLLPSERHDGILRASVLLDRGPRVERPPIVGADVTLICAGDTTCGAMQTDSKGGFVFGPMPPGNFTIRVQHVDLPGGYARLSDSSRFRIDLLAHFH